MNSIDSMVDGIRTAILRWNIDWLNQQKIQSAPPEICRQPAKKLKLVYDSYKDYETTFVPLLMHETWAQIFDEYTRQDSDSILMDIDGDEIKNVRPMKGVRTSSIATNNVINSINHKKSVATTKQFYVGVSDYRTQGESHCSIRCQYLCDFDKLSEHLKLINEGDLVKFDLVVDSDINLPPDTYSVDPITKQKILSVFAYIENVSTERISNYTSLADCFTTQKGNIHLVTYNVTIARRRIRLNTKVLMRMTFLYYIKPMLRQFESIFFLQESLLAKDIFCPKRITCQISVPTVTQIESPNYNPMQFNVIVGANEALSRNHPKIQLIQGPPGTGKTHTLIGIVKHFYKNCFSKEAPKILICAPSNGAIDEVTKRLLQERLFMKQTAFKRSLRMVRIGNSDHISDSVRRISLEGLVEQNSKGKLEEVDKKFEQKIKDLESKLVDCDTEIANLRCLGQEFRVPHVEARIATLFKELESCKSGAEKTKKREMSEASKKNLRIELIKNADVILATLNSCQRHPLDILFKGEHPDNMFHCVIVDEASQCCEPELLMPLRYGVSKLILIGDPMQLPATVISRFAQDFNFGQSLFERFFLHFGKYSNESPIAMLTDQYRMHPDICRFPSKQFYDNRLVSVKSNVSEFVLNPFIVFDLKYSRENKNEGKSIMNEAEASLVRSLLHVVLLSLPENSTVGIITPYKSQQRLITSKLNNIKNGKNIRIDINTCDGFQGQEKDVIILSCVRSFESGTGSIGFLKSIQRVNVALTRAKHSLLVCVSARSLERDKNWSDLIQDAKERNNFHVLTQDPGFNILKNIVTKAKTKKDKSNLQTNVSNAKRLDSWAEIPMDIDMI